MIGGCIRQEKKRQRSVRSDDRFPKRPFGVYAIGAEQARAWVPSSHFSRSSNRNMLRVVGYLIEGTHA
jgi:hypothetical protein